MTGDLSAIFVATMLCGAAWLSGRAPIGELALLSIILAALYLRERSINNRVEFVQLVKSYRRQLVAGGTVSIDNQLIALRTELVTYYLTVGEFFSNIDVPSKYRTVDSLHQPEKFLFSFLSFFTGWWSVPFGPMITLGYISKNLSGGERTKVAEIINPANPPRLRQQISRMLLNNSQHPSKIQEQLTRGSADVSAQQALGRDRKPSSRIEKNRVTR